MNGMDWGEQRYSSMTQIIRECEQTRRRMVL
jgi:hypothetical protein